MVERQLPKLDVEGSNLFARCFSINFTQYGGGMAAKEHSSYQKNVISRYYDNLDTIMLGKLQELVTELYLADSPEKKEQLWQRVHKAMVKLKIKPAIIEHIMSKKDVTVLAKNIADWL